LIILHKKVEKYNLVY